MEDLDLTDDQLVELFDALDTIERIMSHSKVVNAISTGDKHGFVGVCDDPVLAPKYKKAWLAAESDDLLTRIQREIAMYSVKEEETPEGYTKFSLGDFYTLVPKDFTKREYAMDSWIYMRKVLACVVRAMEHIEPYLKCPIDDLEREMLARMKGLRDGN